MIVRDPRDAQEADYDLIAVGGGIQGAMVALEASRRGWRALLVERADFGGETTANSLRIVHGGLRYLQSLDVRRFLESVAERRWYLRRFPDLVRPLPCLLPLYGRGTRRPVLLRVGLALNDLLSWRRNRGLPRGSRIPAGRLLSREATVEAVRDLPRRGLEGGALWYDASLEDASRLVMEVLRWAAAGGARSLNYLEARRLLIREGAVEGVEAVDRLTGERLVYRAPRVLNCAGPWSRALAAEFDRDVPELFRPSLAFNLLLDRPPLSRVPVAVSPPHLGGRTYFLRPWKGRILAGTYHAPRAVADPDPSPRPGEVEAFLSDLEAALPGLGLVADDVVRVDWGLLPVTREGTLQLATREVIVDHGARGGPRGFFSLSGVKLTTARRAAERALRHAFGGRLPAPGAEGDRPEPFPVPSARTFLDLAAERPVQARKWLDRLVSEESVVCVEDLLHRRTDWSEEGESASLAREAIADLDPQLPVTGEREWEHAG